MAIIVQKFGGTSVANKFQRNYVLKHILDTLEEGYEVVVVVSAMGRLGDPYATDTLLKLVNENGYVAKREQDLLLSCGEIISAVILCSMLTAEGIDSIVLTGGQAGIITNDSYTNAQILSLDPKRILDELKTGKVVIVAGFQGKTLDGEVTTLGRGGSDTSATALGVSLKAAYVDIFTDVDGIMTADPSIVDDAKPLSVVDYVEMCNFAFQGAKVIHPRAVEIAMQSNLPIRVRSTISKNFGTLVTNSNEKVLGVRDYTITGITQMPNVSQIKIKANGELDLHLKVFKEMAKHGISVDFISINPSCIAYTVLNEYLPKTQDILNSLNLDITITKDCAKISAVGAGMSGIPGVISKILEALTEEDIPVLQSADSNTTIWILVQGVHMAKAVKALHRKFNL